MALRAPPMIQKIDPITGQLTDVPAQPYQPATFMESLIGSPEPPGVTHKIGDRYEHTDYGVGSKNIPFLGKRYYGYNTSILGDIVDTVRSFRESPIGRIMGIDRLSSAKERIGEYYPEIMREHNKDELAKMAPLFTDTPHQDISSATTATGGGLTDWNWRGLGLSVGGPVGKAYEVTTGAYPGWYGNYAEAQKIAENLAMEGLSTPSVSDQRKGALASEHMNMGQKLAMGIPGIAPVIAGQIVDENDASYGLQAGIDNTVGWFGGMPEGTQTDAYMGLVADALAENNPERLASLNASIPEMVDQMKQQVDTGYDYTPKQLMGIASAEKPYIPDQEISAFDYVAEYEEKKAAAVAARIEEQRIEAERVAQVLADAERARASERANRSQRQAEQAVVAAARPDPGLVAAQSRVVSAPPPPRRKPPPRKTPKKTTKITRPVSRPERKAHVPDYVWIGGKEGGLVDRNNPGMGDVAGPDRWGGGPGGGGKRAGGGGGRRI